MEVPTPHPGGGGGAFERTVILHEEDIQFFFLDQVK